MKTFNDIMKRMNPGGGVTVTITDVEVMKALMNHCYDNKNTATNELPRMADVVTDILRHFLIELRGND